MKNIAVVLGTNYYIGLSTIRCLGVNGITVVAMDYSKKDTYAAKSKYLSKRLIIPHHKEDTEGFVDYLIDFAKKQKYPPVLIPTHDSQVEAIDKYLNELKKYYLMPQTEQGLWTRVMDKGSLFELARQHGMLIPNTVKLNDDDYLNKIENTVGYPCLVKPVDSPSFVAKFRKKLFKVHNREELLDAIKKAKDAGLLVDVQKIIKGFDDHMYTFDAYLNQESKVTHWCTCQKYRQFPINFGASVYTGHKYVPELYDIGGKFLEDIGYKGFAEIEFKRDAESGDFYLIEINARITNFNSLLYKLGLNFPYITYREMIGKPLEPKYLIEEQSPVFWYVFEDILAIRDYIKSGQLTRKEIIKSLFRPKAYAIWDWKDPMPSFAFIGIIMGKIFKRIFRAR